MIDAIIRVALKPTSGGFMWRRIGPYITNLLDESSPPSLNLAITLASPCAGWILGSYTQNAVARWAAAVLSTPYSDAVGQSVVDALLQIASNVPLRPYIPIEIWTWLKKPPCLSAACIGRFWGTTSDVVRHIRGLGDIDLLKSYFLLVWSEWDHLRSLTEVLESVEEEFGGMGMWCH
jgi:hypothetical protein